jgi:hypothetical protein
MTILSYYRIGKKFEILQLKNNEGVHIYYVRPNNTHDSFYKMDQTEKLRTLVLEQHRRLCNAVKIYLQKNGFPSVKYVRNENDDIDYGVQLGMLKIEELDDILVNLDTQF